MRAFLALAVLAAALLAPTATAHGAYHGSVVFPGDVIPTVVRAGNDTAVHLPGDQRAPAPGDPVLVYAINDGPGTARLRLVLEEGEAVATVAQWTLPPDGETNVFGATVESTGAYSLLVSTTHEDWTPVTFYVDYPHFFWPTKHIPEWRPGDDAPAVPHGGALFRFTPEENGTHRVMVTEPAAYALRVEILEATGSAGWPDGYRVLDASTAGNRATLPEHFLEWDATAGTTYYVLATATDTAYPPDEDRRDASHRRGLYDYYRVIPHFEGPVESRGTPAPGLLPLVGLLGLAVLLRRR